MRPKRTYARKERTSHQRARQIIRSLPALPSSLRYLDEYNDEYRSVRKPSTSERWEIVADTSKFHINFKGFDPDESSVLKQFFWWMLSTRAVATVSHAYGGLRSLSASEDGWVLESIERPLFHWSDYWNARVRPSSSREEAYFIKSFMHFMCDTTIGEFRPSHHPFVESLPYQNIEKYKGVLTGEAILTIDQESALVRHLDEMTALVTKTPETVSDETLTKNCLLAYSYQHGLRPVQICRIDLADVRAYTNDSGHSSVHVTAYRAKKRDVAEKTPFTRRIKADWAALFVEYKRRRARGRVWKDHEDSKGKFFTLTKAAIIQAIGDVIEEVTGDRRTATVLRHSAAQRMADAGASLEELAEFLGHSDLDTPLVYFEASPSQAELLNNALAISPIYSRIPKIARTGIIDKASLLGLPADNQVGGMPHGIPITGIGACDIGQSVCIKHPVVACYNCRKFLPVNDIDLHRLVLDHMRSVVRYFFDEARGGIQSQAYTQIARTLEQIQAVIAAIEALDGGSAQS